MTLQRAWLPALVLLLAACGDGGSDVTSTATLDTLPNGATRVRNQAVGAWDSAAAWRFVEEARIGAVEGGGPEVFGDIRDIEVDPLGRVWVLDAQAKRIEVFERDGRHVRTVGRAGGGPGEFEQPIGIELDPAGRIWVHDPGNGRFSVFDTAGALVTTYRRDSILFSYQWQGGITASGRVFDTDMRLATGQEPVSVLVERDTAGASIDTFDLPAFEPELYELVEGGNRRMAAGVPYTGSLVWQIADDGTMWFGISDEYRLVHATLDGDTTRIVEKEWTPLPVSAALRDSALAWDFLDQIRERGGEVDPARVPDRQPAWTAFWIDDRDHLWVTPTRDRGAPALADVFDADGVYLGAVGLPDGFNGFLTPVVVGDRLYGIVRDELGVSYVVIGRLEGRDAS